MWTAHCMLYEYTVPKKCCVLTLEGNTRLYSWTFLLPLSCQNISVFLCRVQGDVIEKESPTLWCLFVALSTFHGSIIPESYWAIHHRKEISTVVSREFLPLNHIIWPLLLNLEPDYQKCWAPDFQRLSTSHWGWIFQNRSTQNSSCCDPLRTDLQKNAAVPFHQRAEPFPKSVQLASVLSWNIRICENMAFNKLSGVENTKLQASGRTWNQCLRKYEPPCFKTCQFLLTDGGAGREIWIWTGFPIIAH